MGNLNAVRHARYSADSDLQRLLRTFTFEQRRDLIPYLRSSGSIKRRLTTRKPTPQYQADNVIAFPHDHATTTTSSHPEQSNQLIGPLAFRLTGHGFVGAHGFLLRHSPALSLIEMIIDFYDELDVTAYRQLRNPGAVIRHSIHEELAEQDGATERCPYCPWRGQERGERMS